MTAAVWQSGVVTMAQAGQIAERVMAELGLEHLAARSAEFYEVNRRLIQTYREATRSLLSLLNEQYREDHQALCEEYGDEIKELWA